MTRTREQYVAGAARLAADVASPEATFEATVDAICESAVARMELFGVPRAAARAAAERVFINTAQFMITGQPDLVHLATWIVERETGRGRGWGTEGLRNGEVSKKAGGDRGVSDDEGGAEL